MTHPSPRDRHFRFFCCLSLMASGRFGQNAAGSESQVRAKKKEYVSVHPMNPMIKAHASHANYIVKCLVQYCG